jgi:hypothetical protein
MLRKYAQIVLAALFVAGPVTLSAHDADAKKYRHSAKGHSHSKHHASKGHHSKGHGNNHHHHHHDNWHHYGNHYGRWVAGGVAAGVTAAAIGSVAYSLPSGCRVVYSGGVKYWDCGGAWYGARYRGSNITYVRVAGP